VKTRRVVVTTSRLGYRSRRFGEERGVFGYEDRALLDYGHSLPSPPGSRTREAALVPRDARVLPAGPHLASAV
jgi:hypothetical protein